MLLTSALPDRTDSYVQFMTVLILFVFVLAITAFVTRWIGGYQRGRSAGTNMELIESLRLSNNKYVQIVRVDGSIWQLQSVKILLQCYQRFPRRI